MESLEYNRMPAADLAELLWSKGKYIEGVEGRDFDASLYSYDGMYVELLYSLEKNQVEKVNILHDRKRLKKYLKQ